MVQNIKTYIIVMSQLLSSIRFSRLFYWIPLQLFRIEKYLTSKKYFSINKVKQISGASSIIIFITQTSKKKPIATHKKSPSNKNSYQKKIHNSQTTQHHERQRQKKYNSTSQFNLKYFPSRKSISRTPYT